MDLDLTLLLFLGGSRIYLLVFAIPYLQFSEGLLGWLSGKESTYNAGDVEMFDPWIGKVPWRRAWQPTPVFLPGESHGQRSLGGYIPPGVAKRQTQLSN